MRFRRRVWARCKSIISVSGITMPGVGGLMPSCSVGEEGPEWATSLLLSPSSMVVAGCLSSGRTGTGAIVDSPSAWKERGLVATGAAALEDAPWISRERGLGATCTAALGDSPLASRERGLWALCAAALDDSPWVSKVRCLSIGRTGVLDSSASTCREKGRGTGLASDTRLVTGMKIGSFV